ncbi:DUF1697 domain-containing protein [Paraglaciecola aestuariivivens]
MNSWVLLLRGINVGGNNIMPMKELTACLNEIGCEQVKSYIQSGNLLLQHAQNQQQKLTDEIATQIQHRFGFSPRLFLLPFSKFQLAAANNPYKAAESEPKSVHLYFLSELPEVVDSKKLEALKVPSESFQLIQDVLYLHAPEGIGRSKLAAKVEKVLGVAVTARNWNTVSKMLALVN